jgi:hypothetical protein
MIVSEEMEEAVDQEPLQLIVERNAVFFRLSPGLMEVDDDITEHEFRGGAWGGWKTVKLGEGEDVGGPVHAAMQAVQHPHPAVIDKEDAELSPVEFQEAERLL